MVRRMGAVARKKPAQTGVRERQKRMSVETRLLFGKRVPDIAKVLYDIAMNPAEATQWRIKAAETILDRALGKVVQHLDLGEEQTGRPMGILLLPSIGEGAGSRMEWGDEDEMGADPAHVDEEIIEAEVLE